jgi:tRNA pseudouridine38-40 synthase
MKNIMLKIEYDGANFHGWQRQREKRTVQGELEGVLSRLCGQEILLHGASRTDAGVHALGQTACFSAEMSIPTDRLLIAANNTLSGGKAKSGRTAGDVRIIGAAEKPPGFHARYDAVGKTYVYLIRNAVRTDVFVHDRCWQLREMLDLRRMEEAAKHMTGTHDFRAFQASGGNPVRSTVRTVYALSVEEIPPILNPALPKGSGGKDGRGWIRIKVTGDGFLYNMVRIMTGTLVETGLGRREPADAGAALAAGLRRYAGCTAPPQGLYLTEVYYDRADMEAESSV